MSQGPLDRWVPFPVGSRVQAVLRGCWGTGRGPGLCRHLSCDVPLLSVVSASPKPLQHHRQLRHGTEQAECRILPPAAPVPPSGSTPAPAAPHSGCGGSCGSPQPEQNRSQALPSPCPGCAPPQAGRAGRGTETPIPEWAQCPPGVPCCGALLQAVVGIGDIGAGGCAVGESEGRGEFTPQWSSLSPARPLPAGAARPPPVVHRALRQPDQVQRRQLRGFLRADPERAGNAAAAPPGPQA